MADPRERRRQPSREPKSSLERPGVGILIRAGIPSAVIVGAILLYPHFSKEDQSPTALTSTATVESSKPPETSTDREIFVRRLEGFFDFSPTASRAEVARKLFPISFQDANWGTNTVLGTLKDVEGKDVTITLDRNGNPQTGRGQSQEADYPLENRPDRTIIETGNNFLVIYGTEDTRSRFQEEPTKTIAQAFLKEYFRDLPSKVNVLHLNFFSKNWAFPLEALGHEELRRVSPGTTRQDALAVSRTLRNGNTGDRERQDVIINITAVHGEAAHQKIFSLEEELRITLGNETATFLPGVFTNARLASPNEAPSAMLGYLAGLDDRWAQLLLGGDKYKEFFPLVIQEMERIGKPKS